MGSPNILLIVIISIIILSLVYLSVGNKPANKPIQQFDVSGLNRPFQPGIYEYEFKTAATPAYPSGKHEKGTRIIKNEVFGQRNISRGTVSYINNNGQLITKEDYSEKLFFKDINGKKMMFMCGNLGNYGLYEIVSENDDGFIYESIFRMSHLIGNNIHKQISKYVKTKDGYKLELVYYDEKTKQLVPYRWGIQRKIN